MTETTTNSGRVILGATYTNANGHRLQPYHADVRGGKVNARVPVHNFTTGYDEAWSVRLFLAEHRRAGQ